MNNVKFEVERDILFYALRYSVGRMTGAPATVAENIMKNIHLFKKHDLEMIMKEINEAKSYGMKCDEETWMSLKENIAKRIMEMD